MVTVKDTPRTHTHEGLRAGALGATVVWLWFFASDWLNGTPMHLAALFGRSLLGLGGSSVVVPVWQAVLAFTIAHFAYWCVLAVITLTFVHAATGTPSVLSLGVTVFILFQFLFVGITAILSNAGLGAFAWPSILLGNIAGCVATWWFIVRRYPELHAELRHVDDDN